MPIEIVIAIVLIALIGGIGFVLYRRMRKGTSNDAPLPDIGEPIDYTSLPVVEQVSLQDRIANLPMAAKILIPVVVLLVLGAGVAVAVWPAGEPPPPPPPPTPIPAITITKALVDRALEPGNDVEIVVEADTTLQGSTTITGELFLDGEPFPWYDLESAVTQVQTSTTGMPNNIEMRLIRSFDEDAPELIRMPDLYTYTIVLQASDVSEAVSDSSELEISPFLIQTPVAEQEPTPTPTLTPTAILDDDDDEEVPEEPTPTTAPPALTVTVANGGRVRASPEILDNNVVDDAGVMAGDVVQVIERTEDGWYRISNPRNSIDGWVGGSLLGIDPATSEQVPLQGSQQPPPEESIPEESAPEEPEVEDLPSEEQVQDGDTNTQPGAIPNEAPDDTSGTASTGLFGTVANGGRVRESPNLNAREVDIINAGENVELLAQTNTSVGVWFQIITERNVTGWTHTSLVTIDEATLEQVPVQSSGAPAPEEPAAAPVDTQPVATNVTAQVSMDGGHVHADPDSESELLQILDGGTEVDVLLRTTDGRWYQVQVPTTALVGWVSVSELFLNPGGDVALTQVPTWEVEPATPVSEAQNNPTDEPLVGSAAPVDSNTCPDSHPIKGTTTGEGEKLYILSFSGSAYDVTPPEICFATELDARESGYRMYVPGNEY